MAEGRNCIAIVFSPKRGYLVDKTIRVDQSQSQDLMGNLISIVSLMFVIALIISAIVTGICPFRIYFYTSSLPQYSGMSYERNYGYLFLIHD